MEIILDADVIIRGEKGAFDISGWLRSRTEDQFGIAAITIAELWHGVERASGPLRAKRHVFLSKLVEPLSVIPYTDQIAYQHARIWADIESSGQMIGYYDLIVAATAVAYGTAVATFNKRHFSRVKGLMLIQPGSTA